MLYYIQIVKGVATMTTNYPIDFDKLGPILGMGIARVAHAVPGTGLVVKRSKWDVTDPQSAREAEFWRSLPAKDKKALPIKDILVHNGIIHFIMKRCKTLSDYLRDNSVEFDDWDELWSIDFEKAKLTRKSVNRVLKVASEYGLCDLHTENLGVDKRRNLVILDAGFDPDGDNRIWDNSDYDDDDDDWCSCTECRNRRYYY